jgi:hypothetical protein
MKAAKVRAPVESILIIKDYSVLKYLFTQKWRAVFEFDNVDGTRKNLQQMTHAPEQSISRESFNSEIKV